MPKRLAALALAVFALACAHDPAVAPPAATLETTPRHHEWISVDSAGRPLHLYVVYPERSTPAPAVIVIHENRGLTDWVRSVADRLAANGYLAVAPDFLSGAGPNGGRTRDFPTEDAAREAIYALPAERVMTDLENTVTWIRAQPSAHGAVSVAGFCWGGSQAFAFANRGNDLTATYVFYGTGPKDAAAVAKIDAPVYGFYGGDDARVNATIDATKAAMSAAGKTYDPVIYPGAGHAFMRAGEAADASPANRDAMQKGWERWLRLLGSVR